MTLDHRLMKVVEALCDDVGSDFSSSVLKLVRESKWRELIALRVRPHGSYPCAETLWGDSMVIDLLRKCKLPTGIDTAQAALDTFFLCEGACAKTNARLSRFLPNRLYIETAQEARVSKFITRWRKEVTSVLGNLPMDLVPRFSGGATYADTGKLTTIPDKMSSAPQITPQARCLLPLWGGTSWSRALVRDRPWKSDPCTVPGNVFFTVPKDGEKDRGCCKEPSINVSYQLDVGKHIRKRLLRYGVDLTRGQDIHRGFAKHASIFDDYATIDLSNASDTVSRVVVKLALPGEWHDLLDTLRSHVTVVSGKKVRLEKFSSMGNGFTFELETLLFVTLARTIAKGRNLPWHECIAYGDDIIVPSIISQDMIAALKFFGFEPNPKKTFLEGPFRESCGGDYFRGTPVRAHFLKETPDEPQKWISLANGLRRVAIADVHTDHRWSTVRRAWSRALAPIPSHIRRCVGPPHLGDVVIHVDDESWRRTLKAHPKGRTWEPAFLYAYVPVPTILRWSNWTPTVQLASCTLGVLSSGISPRGGVSGFKISLVSSLTNEFTPR